MPELPEVETIRRGLVGKVVGSQVSDLKMRPCRVFQASEQELRILCGQRIAELNRRGKFLIFGLDRHLCVFHLGMTGQVTLREPGVPDGGFVRQPQTGLQRARQHVPDKHTHFELHLEGGRQLLYRDVRKFGRIILLDRETGQPERFFSRLGMEPFGEEYSLQSFKERLRGRSLAVKGLLLDQGFVAGVGNIYADEALFESGIHPETPVDRLSPSRVKRLCEAIPLVLSRGIRYGGTTLRDYVNSEGEQGNHQEVLFVYGRKGEPCRVCSTPISKIVLNQRGTHFCSGCQKRGRARPGSRKPAR